MANTVNGFVVIQIGSGTFTLTPADVTPAAAKTALTNLQVQYLADNLDDAVSIGTLGSAAAAAGSAAKTAGQLIEDAFGFTGANALASQGNDPAALFSSAFDKITAAFGGIDPSLVTTFKTAILGIVVKITQITTDVPGKTFTFGIGLDFSSLASIPFPIKLKALSVTFTHTKT